jgi:protein-disulfide isomerase
MISSNRAVARPARAAGTKAGFARVVVLTFAVSMSAAACGASSQSQATAQAGKDAKAAGGASEPCNDYAQRLCAELGVRTDACRSALGVITLMSPRACAAGVADFETTRTRIADLRKACETVADNICAALGKDSESCQAIRQNLPDIPPGHCAALLHDQDQLVAALRQRESMNAPISDARWQALLAGQPPGFGAQDAPVTVVEFTDFQCPFCAQAAVTVNRLKKDYGTRIRLVVRQFPLSIHPDARGAAQAALAAHDQGKFWEYHDQLFGHQDALGPEALASYAQKVGLNVDAFRAAANSESTVQRVAEDMRLGESVDLQGTPTMFIDKKRIDDPIDYDKVAHAVDEALNAKH